MSHLDEIFSSDERCSSAEKVSSAENFSSAEKFSSDEFGRNRRAFLEVRTDEWTPKRFRPVSASDEPKWTNRIRSPAQEPVYKIESIFDGVKLLRCLMLALVIFWGASFSDWVKHFELYMERSLSLPILLPLIAVLVTKKLIIYGFQMISLNDSASIWE